MKEYCHTVVNKLGMHARPAGMFNKLAKRTKADIKVWKGDKSAGVLQILAVMGMGIKQGDDIRITVEGENEEEVMNEVQEICKEVL